MSKNHPPFYGKEISPDIEKKIIQDILLKFKDESATNETLEKIWKELECNKLKKIITIPYQVVLRRDPKKQFPDYIEIILDTKV